MFYNKKEFNFTILNFKGCFLRMSFFLLLWVFSAAQFQQHFHIPNFPVMLLSLFIKVLQKVSPYVIHSWISRTFHPKNMMKVEVFLFVESFLNCALINKDIQNPLCMNLWLKFVKRINKNNFELYLIKHLNFFFSRRNI